MLEPGLRLQLGEALRPPPGARLVTAVGTTYTLDLNALLAVPAALATHPVDDRPDGDDAAAADPVALLESVRRHAECVTMFCQAGGIRVPPRGRPVFAWLEESVIERWAPGGGVFHPKTWTLEYEGDGGLAHRFVCLSRNTTFDSSWDTVVRLDSRPEGSALQGDADGGPLAGFIRALVDGGGSGSAVTGARGASR